MCTCFTALSWTLAVVRIVYAGQYVDLIVVSLGNQDNFYVFKSPCQLLVKDSNEEAIVCCSKLRN